MREMGEKEGMGGDGREGSIREMGEKGQTVTEVP